MIDVFVGVDNGVSGSIGILTRQGPPILFKTPIINELSYTKEVRHINRVNIVELLELLRPYAHPTTKFYLERPMVNSKRFNATLSAIRALETTLDVLVLLKIPYEYIDSKEWQKALLPAGIKGSDALKKASLDIGKRLFPSIDFKGFTDADSLLIAEYQRRRETK